MNRRRFIRNVGASGLAVAALPTFIDKFAVRALAGQDNAIGMLLGDSDRVLVLIQLAGGNDGLNTVVPTEDALYYNNRPNLAIGKNKTVKINDTLGFHPALSGFGALYEQGNLAIVQGVSYPNPDRSHFRGTDIWLTATDADVFGSTGWVGRYLSSKAPNFPVTLPPEPLAVQIGSSLSLGLAGPSGAMGVTFRDPDEFYRLVNAGGAIEEVPSADLGNTQAAQEVAFMRNVAKSADVYASVVKQAADKAPAASVTYPATQLASALKVVAQLITGGLKSKVYLVSLTNGSFDTHANQVNAADPTVGAHAALLTELNGAVTAFMNDLTNQGHADRVAGMTFSEFGRRVAENGSLGTDHGTAAPMFVFGGKVNGAVYGNNPDLVNLDDRGDLLVSNDFREVYASVLLQWFAEPSTLQEQILYHDFASKALPLFEMPSAVREGAAAGTLIGFRSIAPNPAANDVVVSLTVDPAADAVVDVCDLQGRTLATVPVDAFAGQARLNVGALANGTYVLSLRSGRAVSHSLLRVAH